MIMPTKLIFVVLIFSLVGNNIEIYIFLQKKLNHNTAWYCCHKVVSSGNNIFDIP